MFVYAAKMTRFRFALLFVALITASCSTAGPPLSNSADEAGVRAAMSGFMDALNALDANAMSSFFAEDITAFVPVAQDDRVQGRDAVTRIFRNFVARTKPATARLHLVPEDLEIQVSGNLGIVTFNIRDKAPDVTRRRTFVFVRSGNRWLIRHFHASDFVAAAK
jgi:ketosteroid isomerase-like protein